MCSVCVHVCVRVLLVRLLSRLSLVARSFSPDIITGTSDPIQFLQCHTGHSAPLCGRLYQTRKHIPEIPPEAARREPVPISIACECVMSHSANVNRHGLVCPFEYNFLRKILCRPPNSCGRRFSTKLLAVCVSSLEMQCFTLDEMLKLIIVKMSC